ncbi:MAG: head GIN domain-containing protein [Gaiellaceae bacterium]
MSIRALGLLAAAAVVAGCGSTSKTTHGSGNVVTASRDVPSFTKIDFTGAASVSISVGKKTAVAIRGDDNIVPLIRTDVRGDTLVISEKHGFSTENGLDIRVSTPALDSSILSGAGSVTADGINAKSFAADVRGAGRLQLAGQTKSLDVDVSGVGSVELGRLIARDARVTLSGTGSIRVYATGTLDATVNGVGSITYGGNPAQVSSHVNGLGAITAG